LEPNRRRSNRVQIIFEDKQGIVWLGSGDNGLYKYNPGSQDFTRLAVNESTKRVWDIEQTRAEHIWIGTDYGLRLFDKASNTFSLFIPEPGGNTAKDNKIRRISVGESNRLFLGTQDGVLLFETDKQRFTALDVADKLSVGAVYSMIKTDFDHYWLSTDRGVFWFSADDLTLKKVALGFDDRCSQILFQDRQGIIWLSCEGVGVYKITKTKTFAVYADPKVKVAHSVLVAHDDSILIGTARHGIQKWLPATKELTSLYIAPADTIQPAIRHLTQTSRGDIWYANTRSVFSIDKSGVRRQHYPTAEKRELFTFIYDIAHDEQDNIWLATNDGIYLFRDGDIEHIKLNKHGPQSLGKMAPHELYLDPSQRMWVGTNVGLSYWKKETRTLQPFIYADSDGKGVYGHNSIYSIYQDKRQRIWVSTYTGLYLLNQQNTAYTLYNDYFSENSNRGIRFISEDKQGALWLITPTGVSKLNPNTGELQHFDQQDGLPGSRYFLYPTANVKDGTLYLPSREGIYYFDPNRVTEHALSEQTRLTNFEVLGSAQKYNIASVENAGITLKHNESNVKFEFATLDFLNARQIQYSYKLDGFDPQWIENANNSTANYTNLSGGNYTFRVRAAAKKNLWYENELAVNLYIETPWWLRWWMYLVYGSLVFMGIYYYLQRHKRSVIRLEQQVAEKTASIALESSKLAAANQIKTRFLANMSHEIRTPLTTVIGQAEAIICRDVEPKDIYTEVEIIHNSSLYLLSLLNDMLDVTKIEENKFELEPAPQDLHGLLININTMFSLQAKVKGLSFSLHDNLPTPFVVNIDGLRLKQILINLCSNAIKFTLQGQVCLNISAEEGRLVFKIEDTGIGITESQLKKIFVSFTQGDSSIRRRFGGSGLGLHLSNQLVKLMGGSITVLSHIDQGSVFTFSLPMTAISAGAEVGQAKTVFDASVPEPLFSGTVLLAEDHSDNRRLIARLLTKLGLTVFTARDGLEAIELYVEHLPGLVLLDIQMPKMDGIQAYQALRDLGCTGPIIALTANAMTKEVEQYLSLGFDGYLKKPLDRQLLIATIALHFKSKVDKAEQQADVALGKVDMSDLVLEFKASLVTEQQQFILHGVHENHKKIAERAHSLCGAAQLFGFAQLSLKAANVEASIKHKSSELTHIKADLQSLLDEIEAILAD
ncbi:MAG: signal transduction histidine kinase/CheY-like chemotaxis protein/streptogramin lyase, partial [Paraglaciecola sp.]